MGIWDEFLSIHGKCSNEHECAHVSVASGLGFFGYVVVLVNFWLLWKMKMEGNFKQERIYWAYTSRIHH